MRARSFRYRHRLRQRALAAGLLAGMAGIAGAQPAATPYPSKTITIIVPTTPGGGVDNGARMLAEKLRAAWGQTVVVENRPGANYIIGTAAVARAPADGHTLLFTSNSFVVVPLASAKLPYDPADLAPVGTLAYSPYVMVTRSTLAANTVQEFIAHAKAHPGKLNYGGTVSAGSHIAGEVFNHMSGTRMQFVPYKGGAPVMVDLVGGQIDAAWNSVNAAAAQIRAGKVKALAVTGEQRYPTLPAVPTFAEAGFPQYQERAWLGLFAPSGTPRAIVQKLSAELARVANAPEMKPDFDASGLIPLASTPEQFAAMLKKEADTLRPVLKASNFRLDAQ
ncbi:Bug family tripartite tricarboxylate transporter substrate binding protein [Pseudorhodoferax sp. LjRoot39]|uniref:Bug family tripartite tricarboxylate transporter substrate binding protein n=1 Tax=Pseudorhodoferax sp. LjRoot39 TaxID=3342328 RepID=UPI003F4FBC64